MGIIGCVFRYVCVSEGVSVFICHWWGEECWKNDRCLLRTRNIPLPLRICPYYCSYYSFISLTVVLWRGKSCVYEVSPKIHSFPLPKRPSVVNLLRAKERASQLFFSLPWRGIIAELLYRGPIICSLYQLGLEVVTTSNCTSISLTLNLS